MFKSRHPLSRNRLGGREGGGEGGNFHLNTYNIPPSTDAGKVLKVVFATNDSVTFPVIVEEISLDDDNNIEKMAIRDRYLFVNTHSKIYKFPLARCLRHESCM